MTGRYVADFVADHPSQFILGICQDKKTTSDVHIAARQGKRIRFGHIDNVEPIRDILWRRFLRQALAHHLEIAGQRRIFEQFGRAVSSRNYGGLGLGLWIVRKIVEAHGGNVGVASELGRGARFEVWLPTTHAKALP